MEVRVVFFRIFSLHSLRFIPLHLAVNSDIFEK